VQILIRRIDPPSGNSSSRLARRAIGLVAASAGRTGSRRTRRAGGHVAAHIVLVAKPRTGAVGRVSPRLEWHAQSQCQSEDARQFPRGAPLGDVGGVSLRTSVYSQIAYECSHWLSPSDLRNS